VSATPGWTSTIFGVYFWAGGVTAALGTLAVLTRRIDLARPALARVSASSYRALGKMILTFVLFWTYIAIDATFRFLIDFTRYYDATSYLGKIGPLSFNVNQVFSVFLVAASIFMLVRLKHAAATRPAFSPIPEAQPESPA